MSSAMQPSNDLRKKRLQKLGETLKELTPKQRAQAVKIAAGLLKRKAAGNKG